VRLKLVHLSAFELFKHFKLHNLRED